jgi:hypothetical protein
MSWQKFDVAWQKLGRPNMVKSDGYVAMAHFSLL